MSLLLWQLSPSLAQWGEWHMLKVSWELTKLLILGGGTYGGILLLTGIRLHHLKAGREG